LPGERLERKKLANHVPAGAVRQCASLQTGRFAYWRFLSSFFTFLSAFFSFAVLAGSFFVDFFASWLLLMSSSS
jgi:hypothetical protein